VPFVNRLLICRQETPRNFERNYEFASHGIGAERIDLSPVRPVLMDLESGRCFYCGRGLQGSGAVDHFIAWSRYPVDLGHNFVLAHASCNSSKGDHLAAFEHLARWAERNALHAGPLRVAFEEAELPSDPRISRQVAHWAYSQGGDGTRTWAENNRFVPLPRSWMQALEASTQAWDGIE
jgi:5-methylcytosine-specific restriction endonuclease McrA